jgi:hypothetical protein
MRELIFLKETILNRADVVPVVRVVGSNRLRWEKGGW